jgi:ribokinase
MIAPAPAGGAVVVLGSANMDLLLRVPALPAAGETVLGDDATWRPGGKGANQAVAAALGGAAVRMIGCVGADEHGRAVRRALEAAGVDVAFLRVDGDRTTGMAVVLVAQDGENAIAVSPGANHALTEDDLAAAIGGLRTGDVLLAQLEVPQDVVGAAIAAAAAAGGRPVLNLAPAAEVPGRTLAQLELLVVNRSEAEFLLGRSLPDAPARRDGAAELLRIGPRAVVLTAGGDGAVVADADGTREHPARPVPVVDTAGAGDAFVGVLCARLAGGASLDDAVAVATRAGAAAVGSAGAQLTALDPTEEDRPA